MKKSFIITIDTESDNQWIPDSRLTTENSHYIPRFQDLCEKYGFKPVYLTDYSMANDDYYIHYIREKIASGLCEVGMHLHAWDTPPFAEEKTVNGSKPYLIEYSDKIMYEKVSVLTDLLETKLGTKMFSHRAGRWALDERYINVLEKWDYKIDCSVTPGVDWSSQIGREKGGSNYSSSSNTPYYLTEKKQLLEVPMTVRRIKVPLSLKEKKPKSLLKAVYYSIVGKNIWLRPSISSNEEIELLLNEAQNRNADYIEFMMHSSEFMPGGSPYFKDKEAIESLFHNLETLFDKISGSYEGTTLEAYYNHNYEAAW